MALRGAGGSDSEVPTLLGAVVEAGAPGALVLVRDEEGTETFARGAARLADGRRLRANDRFRVGSISKTFVATVVLQLDAERELDLDDNVERWLPGVVPHGRTVTLRQLLSHTSGLADYVEDDVTAREWRPRTLAVFAVSRPAVAAPGARFAYASTNYVLLGLVVERATGLDLGHALERRIFGPLGLEETSFEPGPRELPVHGHRPPSFQGIVTGNPVDTGSRSASWAWAAGAFVSNASDLARFYRALLEGRLLPPRQMRELRSLAPAGPNRYGLGVTVFPTPCGPAWGHTGNVNGTVTSVWSTGDGSRQAVLMANVYPLTPGLEAAFGRARAAAFCRAR